jgi:hypothetical protein
MVSASGAHWRAAGRLAFVDRSYVLRFDTLPDILAACRWELSLDAEGSGTELRFLGQKLGSDEEILRAFAPFVEPGGYVTFLVDEQFITPVWRWLFVDGGLVVLPGRLKYPSDVFRSG